jgi:adenylosuccinate synthase
LTKAIKLNGVTKLIMNKMDVLRELEEWALRDSKKDTSFSFSTEEKFKDFFNTNFPNLEISFSYSPEEI